MTTETTIRPFEAPAAAHEQAVREIVADYYGAWFDGDAERMARTLHPDLAKRGWILNQAGEPLLDQDTYETMVEWTRQGLGRPELAAERALEIRVVEVCEDVATALVHTLRFIETLHLIRTADEWRILNALWRAP